MGRAASLAGTLFVFWLLLSGMFVPFLLGMGVASVVAVALLARRMDVIDHEGHPVHLGPGTFRYWPWLAMEIVKSGWSVTKVILDPKLPIDPAMVRFRPGQRTQVGLAVHANSITLTPGTVSIEVTADEILVHALVRESAEGMEGGEMDERVSQFEGRR